jgi:hypothetical protein
MERQLHFHEKEDLIVVYPRERPMIRVGTINLQDPITVSRCLASPK